MIKKFDIIVVGGGIIGATFALNLAINKPNFKIAIIDKLDFNKLKIDNRFYAISPNNIANFINLDVLPSNVGSMNKIQIFTDQNGFINLDSKLINKTFIAKIVDSYLLHQNLIDKLKMQYNVELITDNLLQINNNDNLVLIHGKDTTYSCNLLIGSDGSNSWIKKELNIKSKSKDYQQYGIVANFESELDHDNTGFQWFVGEELLAFLPLTKNKISIVLSTSNYKYLLNTSDDNFINLIRAKSNNRLGDLKLLTKPIGFPLKLDYLNILTNDKVILIGDAAHTVHPLAGQGINLGLNDARVLVEIISKKKHYQLIDQSILLSYNNLRVPQIRVTQFCCDALFNMNVSNPLIKKIFLKTGFNIFNKSSLLKKFLLEYVKNH